MEIMLWYHAIFPATSLNRKNPIDFVLYILPRYRILGIHRPSNSTLDMVPCYFLYFKTSNSTR